MKYLQTLFLSFVAGTVAIVTYSSYQPPMAAQAAITQYNVVDFGAIGDGNPANAAKNTAAFQNAIAIAANSNEPAAVFVPMSKGGFVVNNGQIKLQTPGMMFKGESGMGTGWKNSPASTIIGIGQGPTVDIAGLGCNLQGIVFRQNTPGEMKGESAFILCRDTQCTIKDCYMRSPNIGILMKLPPNTPAEGWIKDILMEEQFGTAGIVVDFGGGTVHINHVIMSCFDPTTSNPKQPPFGIKAVSCGELIINNGCDIINMGNCLGIVPGFDGVKDQFVDSVFVSDSLFDGGNGQGCVWVRPTNRGYCLTHKYTNVWCSTAGNNGGTFPTNGFMFDATQSVPALPTLRAIQDVTLTNCVAKSFRNHCGVYASGVDALNITASTFGDCFNGIQAKNCSSLQLIGNKCGNYVPPSQTGAAGGNQAYGILIEPTTLPLTAAMNMCYGNGIGTILNQNPLRPFQMFSLNQ